MRNFNRGRSGGERGFERRGFSGRGSSGPAQMFQTTCDKCRMNCEVPFRPTNGRPVFCSNCFEDNRGSDTGRYESRNEDRQMFDATCDNCHNSCKVPFKPSNDKPIYCSNCFESKREGPRGDRPQNSDQFVELHSKLDKILSLLSSNASKPAVVEEVVEQVIETTEPEVVKVSKKKSPKKK